MVSELLEVDSRQLVLELDWGREPWAGLRPRCLTREYLRNVDNSDTLPEAARRMVQYRDPHQLQLCVNTSFKKEVS